MGTAATRSAPDAVPAPVEGPTYGRIVRAGAAFLTAGAGVLHLDAAGDHTDHWYVTAFFVAVACAQLLWAAAAVRPSTSSRLFAAGLLVDAGVLVVWVVSRTVGLPDLAAGIGGVEELGWKDAAASGLAFAALAAGGLALAMPSAAAAAVLAPRTGERVLRAMAAATLLVTIPGALASHGHGEHGHGDDHTHGELTALPVRHDEAEHVHEDGAGHAEGEDHPHDDADHAHDGADHAADHAAHSEAEHDATEPHVHATVLEGDPHAATAAGPAHDHAVEVAPAGHVHGPSAPTGATAASAGGLAAHDHAVAAASAALPEPDPMAGPGRITTVRLGPFALLPSIPGLDLPHGSPAMPWIGPGAMNLLPLVGVPAPCQDCYVLGMQPDLVYLDGTSANLDTGPMLHHMVWTDMSRTDPVCGRDSAIGNLGHRVFASGNERTGFAAPEGFGVPFGRGTWGGVVELMNMSTELKVVFVQLTARWVPRSTEGILPATPVWLDIDSCGDSAVDIGSGVTDIPWEWPSSVTGRIITAGGHLHDGGEWLSLRNATSGEHVCTSVAGYGTDPRYRGALESMSTCTWDRLASVRKGDVLRLNAHYNTTRPEKGVMGIMVVLIHETTDLDGGTPSPYPTDPPPSTGPPTGHAHAH